MLAKYSRINSSAYRNAKICAHQKQLYFKELSQIKKKKYQILISFTGYKTSNGNLWRVWHRCNLNSLHYSAVQTQLTKNNWRLFSFNTAAAAARQGGASVSHAIARASSP
jgi:ribosomal protein L20